MKVLATNIAQPREILWKGKTEFTGIYKVPVAEPIFLGKESVHGDTISQRSVHGGVDKACYLFSAKHYDYWKNKYPHLPWDWGMFGENLTVSDLDESKLRIGDRFSIGEAVVEVSEPREPCYKLGIRFGHQKIIQDFITHGYPGTYVRVLKEGSVKAGDDLRMEQQSANTLTVTDFFQLRYMPKKDPELLKLAMDNPALAERKKEKLRRYL